MQTPVKAPTQQIEFPELSAAGVEVYVRREDLLHAEIPGNKFRKLCYNLEKAATDGYSTLLTFGGAYSNHIAATAAAGRIFGFNTIGVIRGEELGRKSGLNPTLDKAAGDGMRLHFVSREAYRTKDTAAFIQGLNAKFGEFYLLPEGGSNALAVKGCGEILDENDRGYNVICCSVGTGGTLAGLIRAAFPGQQLIGFPALKGGHIIKDICSFVGETTKSWSLEEGYTFGGYAKINEHLVTFINSFRAATGIPLDPVYTGKMFYGILGMAKAGRFEAGTRILAIHSGGLQGIAGANQKLLKKNLPQINL